MAQFKAALDRLADVGFLRTTERMRKINDSGDPPVFEVKVHVGPGYRLYCIQRNRRYYATHGGPKVSRRQLMNEVKRAREIFEEGVGSA